MSASWGWRDRHVATCVVVGLLSGLFASWCYYQQAFRLIAHSLGFWVLLVALAAARRDVRSACVRSVVLLIGAVTAFYVGKKLFYGIKYPGMPYDVDVDSLVLWCVFAVVAGVVLGGLFHAIGADSWRGAFATTAAVGLLFADTYREDGFDLDRGVVLSVLALVGTLALLARQGFQAGKLKRFGLLIVPVAALSYVVVLLPDVIEGVLL
jgi:Family of unknown function (DUF6518)